MLEIDRDKLEEFCKDFQESKDIKNCVKKFVLKNPDDVAKILIEELADYFRRNPDKLTEIAQEADEGDKLKEETSLPKETIDANLTDEEKKIYYMLLEKARRKEPQKPKKE